MSAPDVIIIGGGIAGLTTAFACARRGLTVTLIDAADRGAASSASAGVLGPSIGRGPKSGRVGRFMFAARDRYPAFLAELRDLTGVRVPTVEGAIELALNETHLAELRARGASLPDAVLLDAEMVAALEPALVRVAGALHHPRDGAVDVAALLDALHTAVIASGRVTTVSSRVEAIAGAGGALPDVTLGDGSVHRAPHIVLAGGAWTTAVRGLPRALPLRPVKGEVARADGAAPVRRVVFGAGGYLVPRGGSLLIGATSEEAGFDVEPTTAAAATLVTTARALLDSWPAGAARFPEQWAGLRPMTPDGYPILGRDPEATALLYACGYSRNGVLVSPLAAECIAALIVGEKPEFDLSAFAVTRFRG